MKYPLFYQSEKLEQILVAAQGIVFQKILVMPQKGGGGGGGKEFQPMQLRANKRKVPVLRHFAYWLINKNGCYGDDRPDSSSHFK